MSPLSPPRACIPSRAVRLLAAVIALVLATAAPARAQSRDRVPPFTALTAGLRFSCGLTADGRAFCWGTHAEGQLGAGMLQSRCDASIYATGPCARVPVEVRGGHTFTQLRAGGTHACGIDDEGALWCWGEGAMRAIATSTSDDDEPCMREGGLRDEPYRVSCSRTPVRMPVAPPVIAVDGGTNMTCAVNGGGAAWCWTHDARFGFARIPLDRPLVSIAAGDHLACGLTDERGVRCWNWLDLRTKGATAPTPDTGWIALDVGADHACALDADGGATCWGRDRDAALGIGRSGHEMHDETAPTPVVGGHAFARLATGPTRSCGIEQGGALWCWGRVREAAVRADDQCLSSNWLGGDDNDCWSRPVRVHAGRRFTSVAIGGHHQCAIERTGATLCWGENTAGQLGDGTLRATPVAVRVRTERLTPATERWLAVRVALGRFLAGGGVALVAVALLLGLAHDRVARWGWPELGALALGALVLYTVAHVAGPLVLDARAQGAIAGTKRQLLMILAMVALYRLALQARAWWRAGGAAGLVPAPAGAAPSIALPAPGLPAPGGRAGGSSFLSLGIVLAGWVMLAMAWHSVSTGPTPRGEIAGGIAMLFIFVACGLNVVLALAGGALALARLRLNRRDIVARATVAIAGLTVLIAAVAYAWMTWPTER